MTRIWASLVYFPGGSDGKEPACNERNQSSITGLGRFLWRRKWQPTPVLLPGELHGQGSLVGYRSWGCKALDTTGVWAWEEGKMGPPEKLKESKAEAETWGRRAYGARLLQGEIHTWRQGLTREQGRGPSGDYWGGRVNIIRVSRGREWRKRKRIWDVGFRV